MRAHPFTLPPLTTLSSHTTSEFAEHIDIQPTIKQQEQFQGDPIYNAYHQHSTGLRLNTDALLVENIRKAHPSLHLSITSPYTCNLFAYANAGQASATPVDTGPNDTNAQNLKHRGFVAPARRLDGDTGFLFDQVLFGKYMYKWSGKEYIVYSVLGSDSTYAQQYSYILGPSAHDNDELILAACDWGTTVHDQVLVFDDGHWQSSRELWESVQGAAWEDVILEEGMKRMVQGEVNKFFQSRERYRRLRVPWKRGMLLHGPPGNGKTISIKAIMHTLYARPTPIPTLYVRSLVSFRGPEYSISQIFTRARQQAPCLLVLEDLDTIITPDVRSYFLNEVDGLRSNDGILMVGSTNHLDRLDPGIAKRPSRFDRKFLFPEPGFEERVSYCGFWRKKLEGSGEVEFPVVLEKAIARITDGFSFAYMQEAFVASLLAIANRGDDGDEDGQGRGNHSIDGMADGWISTASCTCSKCNEHQKRECIVNTYTHYWVHACDECEKWLVPSASSDLDQYVLWREIKKAVKILREELDQEDTGSEDDD